MTNRRWLAIHEAGHIVMSRLAGVPVTGAALFDRAGRTFTVTTGDRRVDAMTLLGGYYANQRDTPGDPRNAEGFGVRPDGRLTARSDAHKVYVLLAGDDTILSDVSDHVIRAFAHPDVWAMVEEVAGALVERGRLNAHEVLALTS